MGGWHAPGIDRSRLLPRGLVVYRKEKKVFEDAQQFIMKTEFFFR